MNKTRTFIAIEISPGVCGRAGEIITKLQASEARVAWVQPRNLHLTLKFLGDVPNVELNDVCRTVADAVRGFEPFELVYRGVGAFPNVQEPRTVWLGVDQGAPEVIELQSRVDQAMKKLRFPVEPRRFRPHLTLGRVRGGGPGVVELSRLITENADADGDLSIVDEVIIFGSYREGGSPVYEPLGHAELTGGRPPRE